MGKILTFAPLTLFAYQIFLASTGRSPLTIFNLVPHHIFIAALALLRAAPYEIMAQYYHVLQVFNF